MSGPTSNRMATVTVEFLPGVGPGTATGSWVDLTANATQIDMTRGRTYELDRYEPGQMTLELQAFDRTFDQDYSTGTYAGSLLPLTQVRYSLTWAGTAFKRFRGYITDLGQTIQDDKLFTATWTVADAFTVLDQSVIDFSAWSTTITAAAPNAWFRFDDTGRVTDATGNNGAGFWSGTPALSTGPIVGDPSQCVAFDGNFTGSAYQGLDFSGADDSFEFWVNTSATTGTLFQLGANLIQFVAYLVAGKLRVWNSGSSFYDEMDTAIDDGIWHHVIYTDDSHFFLDGVAVTKSASGPATPTQAAAFVADGDLLIGNNRAGNDGFVGSLDELVLYNGTLLLAADALAHYEAGTYAWTGDDSGARLSRVLDGVGFPAELRAIGTGVSTVQPFDAYGQSALQYCQALADTEAGDFFVDGGGTVTFRNRQWRYTDSHATTVQGTIADTRGVLKATEIVLKKDDTLLRNPVSASRQGGVTVVASDSTLISTYGQRAWSAPVSLDDTDAPMADRAHFYLDRFKDRNSRLESMIVEPTQGTALWGTILPLEMGYRFRVDRQPLGTGGTIQSLQWLEKMHETLTPFTYTAEFVGGPVDTTAYFILNTATGTLGTNVLGY